jgi:hypothetical protein
MKPLTQEQIEAVISWMNEYDQIRNTLIPVRFREYFEAELKNTKQMEPYLIMTGVSILKRDLALPRLHLDEGGIRHIKGELQMRLAIDVQGSGDLIDYIVDDTLDHTKILYDVIEGRLKIYTVNEL